MNAWYCSVEWDDDCWQCTAVFHDGNRIAFWLSGSVLRPRNARARVAALLGLDIASVEVIER